MSDSRAQKYIDFLKERKIEYKLIAWNRIGVNSTALNVIYYQGSSKYNQRGWHAAADRVKWMWFVYKTLKSLDCTNMVIHACDLDASYPASMFKKFAKNKPYIIFDVFDWFSDNLADQGKTLVTAFHKMEKVAVTEADHIIICEEERTAQIPFDIKGKYSVLPNVPSFSNSSFLKKDDAYKFDNDKITLAYVGGFLIDRCLDMLIDGAEQGVYNLLIAGFGDAALTKRLENSESPNIKYFGKVVYKQAQIIMYNADAIYAMYSKVSPNNIFAAPNKYYECMFLGKPIVTTAGIIMSKKVVKNNMGYVIEENLDSLKEVVGRTNTAEMAEKATNASKLWNYFKDCTRNYLEKVYLELLKL